MRIIMDNNTTISGTDFGSLRISVVTNTGYTPIPNARIQIASSGEPDIVIEELTTDSSGNTPSISLQAPPLEYSMSPTDNQPYSEYNVKVFADDYDEEIITNIQIFSGQPAVQQVRLSPAISSPIYSPTVIPGHTLWEFFPPKIAESEIKDTNSSGEIVLSRVVVPETIVVHDGVPSDDTATNYFVPYLDYIKNVASCEIYTTWPEETIKANILAIMSFTLNRVYTEWYRNKGYDFTITSSTAFDHKWTYNKTIYNKISQVADSLYGSFIARPNVKQPILTQYCDGKRVSCPNWMTQWGSKTLGDDGLSAIQILRYYYGDDVYINNAEIISGIPASYPGYNLTIGSTGDPVITIQEQLNRIARNYPALPTVSVDGIFGNNTANAVRSFQEIFNLPASGIVDYPTWYKISQIYVGVTKIGENV
ncbi:MAG: peptidoglycan-binding protein [Lachnospiraceae bacterium]|nr:peptidoglycan-binding protein [Lachnospiraceae bacterium]